MATIRAGKQSDGTTRYTAIIRIRKRRTIIYQEYKTFALRTAAVSWAKHREVELEKPGSLYRAQHGTPTLAELMRWYIDTFKTISKWQRSQQTHLEFLERHAIGKANALTLTSAMLIDHVRSRRVNGTGPGQDNVAIAAPAGVFDKGRRRGLALRRDGNATHRARHTRGTSANGFH